jgi:hypothetical protein
MDAEDISPEDLPAARKRTINVARLEMCAGLVFAINFFLGVVFSEGPMTRYVLFWQSSSG